MEECNRPTGRGKIQMVPDQRKSCRCLLWLNSRLWLKETARVRLPLKNTAQLKSVHDYLARGNSGAQRDLETTRGGNT